MTAQAICCKCYQLFNAESFQEHQTKKCFPLMLKPMKLTMVTTVPLNVIAHMLERMNIPIISASADYPDVVFHDPPPSMVLKSLNRNIKWKK